MPELTIEGSLSEIQGRFDSGKNGTMETCNTLRGHTVQICNRVRGESDSRFAWGSDKFTVLYYEC